MGCFKIWCLDNFPFMEDDIKALDNYHALCKLYEYIKNVAGDVSTIASQYSTLVSGFEELKAYVDEYLESLDDVKADIVAINSNIDTLTSQVNANSNRIDQAIQLINENFTILKNYIDEQVAVLDNKIDNIQIGQIDVYDPTTGLITPLQIVINNLYGLSNKDGLTATEFDALDLTATAFDSYNITAYEFDSEGKIILV